MGAMEPAATSDDTAASASEAGHETKQSGEDFSLDNPEKEPNAAIMLTGKWN